MTLNKKQRNVVLFAIILIAIFFIIWIINGADLFTKTKILIEKKDELLGTTVKEWKDKFIWGLDLTLAGSAVVLGISAFFIFLFKEGKSSD